jgi:hypothetical protein
LPWNINRKFEHALHCHKAVPWLLTNDQSLWLTTWLSFPSSLLTKLSLLWFRFISKLKNKTGAAMFWNEVRTSKGNQKRYSTPFTKITFECWEKLRDHCIRSQRKYFEEDGSQNWVSYVRVSFLT